MCYDGQAIIPATEIDMHDIESEIANGMRDPVTLAANAGGFLTLSDDHEPVTREEVEAALAYRLHTIKITNNMLEVSISDLVIYSRGQLRMLCMLAGDQKKYYEQPYTNEWLQSIGGHDDRIGGASFEIEINTGDLPSMKYMSISKYGEVAKQSNIEHYHPNARVMLAGTVKTRGDVIKLLRELKAKYKVPT